MGRRSVWAQPVRVGVVAPPVIGPSLSAKLAKYKGRWVAVDPPAERVVASGGSASEVITVALAAQVTDPLVFRVPAQPGRIRLL